MAFSAFCLVVVAATLHALWNLVAKKASGNIGVFWLGLCFATLLLAPVVLLLNEPIGAAGLQFVAATGLIHSVYFGLLAAAYRHGEMSVVYPLARGSGVAGTALVAWAVLDEQLSLLGILGILSICAGILLLGVRELFRRSTLHSCLLALLVGATIVGYSIVDKRGVGLVHPVLYITGLGFCTALFLAPYALLRYPDECRDAWTHRKSQCAWVGVGVLGTYLLILYAFQAGSVSYVVAVRELSIVVVALLSMSVLREPVSRARWASIIVILVGVVLVKMA